jgi:hypothetical protein
VHRVGQSSTGLLQPEIVTARDDWPIIGWSEDSTALAANVTEVLDNSEQNK